MAGTAKSREDRCRSVLQQQVLHDDVDLELVRAGEALSAVEAGVLLLAVKGPDVLPDVGILREPLQNKS